MKKNLLIVLVVAAVAGLAVIAARQRAELARLRNVAPPAVIVQAPLAPEPVAPEPPAALPEPPPVVPPPVPPAQKPASLMSRLGEMTKDPAFKDMMRAQQKMMLNMTFNDLFERLELTGEDLENFKQLLGDRQNALMDASLALMNRELSPADRAQKMKELEQSKAGHDKLIEEFLGAEDFAEFKYYEETQGERMQVNLLRRTLTGAEALTEQQEVDLVAAMYQDRQGLPAIAAMGKTIPDPAKFTEEGIAEMQKQMESLQEKYLQSAAPILSAPQLEKFKLALEQQRAMQAMGLKMAGQMFGRDAQPAAAPQP